MPKTRKPQERAEILDELLAHRNWTGNELLEQVNQKLQNLDEKPVDMRTLRRDLNYLELKGAPLHRPKKGDMTYSYEYKFSLKDVPLDSDDLRALKQAINILRKVENFQMMDELDLIIGKLANRIHTNVPDNQTIVQFENHTSAKGAQWFNELFDSIREQTTLDILYHSYRHAEPKEHVVHPYLLKEYRNRWWLIGREDKSNKVLTLGLDRIQKVKVSKQKFKFNDLFHPDTFFDKVIGVSMDYDKSPEDITLRVNPVSVRHVESKPIHKCQEPVRMERDGSLVIKLNLIINYELKATILGFGDGIEVLEPLTLRDEIKSILERSHSQYRQT
ncbi:helix-turn-helix transcriptional regulator [Dawidia soli]|uniref:WYL domain-containing protein n=1 Tax=Dawidia soli TaxID=2782352 RepID=A0AAP2DER5_9BACT|nr:WYL domain-containing protein [Dawidia soli]MBT1689430.1 WYL domain-containing protein [Dawidia soli]